MTEMYRFSRRLEEGRWTVRDAGDLQRVIARAAEAEAQWQGIAYTTAPAAASRRRLLRLFPSAAPLQPFTVRKKGT